jgi:quercetin dioxygenase-like cupin family protein
MPTRRLARSLLAAAAGLAALAAPAARAQIPPGPSVLVKPADVRWKPDPRAAGAQEAVLVGDPTQGGFYVLRVKVARGSRIAPHTHPDMRYATVLSGTLMLGFGNRFDPAALRPYAAGTLLVIPAHAPHFLSGDKGEAVVQFHGMGPTGSTPVTAATR